MKSTHLVAGMALLMVAALARAQDSPSGASAEAKLKAEIARMKLALKTQQEITKALHSTDYAEAVYRRDAQNMALVKADIQRMRRTSDWASASPSARRSALELIEQVGLERLKYDELARDRLLDKFCLTPEDVNTAASDCYKVLYSPNLILLK